MRETEKIKDHKKFLKLETTNYSRSCRLIEHQTKNVNQPSSTKQIIQAAKHMNKAILIVEKFVFRYTSFSHKLVSLSD